MSSDDETAASPSGSPTAIDFARIQGKIDNLPTVERLLQEGDPNAYTAEQLQEAACFVCDLLAARPQDEQDVERHQRRLQKTYRKVFKKSLLLAAYKQVLQEGAPVNASAASATTEPPLSKRQMKREAKQKLLRGAAPTVSPQASGTQQQEEELVVAGVDGRAPTLPDVEDIVGASAGKRAGISGLTPAGARRAPVAPSPVLERFLVTKAPRSQSGVLVVTVFTSPYPDGQRFSCQWNCYYCPNEPNQPRSYLLNEPGVRRANRLEFNAVRQFTERVRSLVAIGHPADKVELLVLGGTWESYPLSYRNRFMRDLFYAANTIFDAEAPEDGGLTSRLRRPPLDLLQEQLINEHALCKIIGVTLETRPDTINPEMLKELRRFGCTRVQLGVQHTDDAILTKVNRQATREDTMRAIKLLKDACFKVDIHLMPDLPGASPDIDKAMFDDVLQSPYLQADQWKVYPCQTTPFTVIEDWYKQGLYTPYGLEQLIDVLLYVKTRVHPWIRLNRVVRDIPVDYVLAGVEVANLRQLLAIKLQERGQHCRCIRCREVKGDKNVARKLRSAELKERVYEASEGTETFLSVETPDEATIFAFLRLRTNMRNDEDTPFPELRGCALIRELHVYGHLIPTYATAGDGEADTLDGSGKAQHTGLGTRLLARAEEIAREAGYPRIAVISGVGVRGYYKRRGYRLYAAHCGGYLIKDLTAGETGDTPTPSATLGEWPGVSVFSKGRLHEATAQGVDGSPSLDGSGGSADEQAGSSTSTWRGALANLWERVSSLGRKREREG